MGRVQGRWVAEDEGVVKRRRHEAEKLTPEDSRKIHWNSQHHVYEELLRKTLFHHCLTGQRTPCYHWVAVEL